MSMVFYQLLALYRLDIVRLYFKRLLFKISISYLEFTLVPA